MLRSIEYNNGEIEYATKKFLNYFIKKCPTVYVVSHIDGDITQAYEMRTYKLAVSKRGKHPTCYCDPNHGIKVWKPIHEAGCIVAYKCIVLDKLECVAVSFIYSSAAYIVESLNARRYDYSICKNSYCMDGAEMAEPT